MPPPWECSRIPRLPLPFSCNRVSRAFPAAHQELFRTMNAIPASLRSPLAAILASFACAALAGCALGSSSQIASPTSVTPQTAPLKGRVHGGQQVVEGAHIYLFAASTYGYGYNSLSLIRGGTPGVYTDPTGAGYVLTDKNGNFNLSGAYNCAAGQQIYILAQGGNPGLPAGTDNTALTMISVLGACPTDGTFAGHVAYVDINEVSTIGAVYALAGFMTDVTHVSAPGTPAAQRGLANAFATFANLVNLAAGEPRTLSASQGNGAVPATKINTLADILAPCINSNGSALVCTALFNARPRRLRGHPHRDHHRRAQYRAQPQPQRRYPLEHHRPHPALPALPLHRSQRLVARRHLPRPVPARPLLPRHRLRRQSLGPRLRHQ